MSGPSGRAAPPPDERRTNAERAGTARRERLPHSGSAVRAKSSSAERRTPLEKAERAGTRASRAPAALWLCCTRQVVVGRPPERTERARGQLPPPALSRLRRVRMIPPGNQALDWRPRRSLEASHDSCSQRPHGEGREEARTAKGRVRGAEDAQGQPGPGKGRVRKVTRLRAGRGRHT